MGAHVNMLSDAVQAIRGGLGVLTPEQKKAVYLKLNTQVDLSPSSYASVGLRPVSWRGKSITVAVTDEDKLERFLNGAEAVRNQLANSATRSAVFNITQPPVLIPKADRMSKRLLSELDGLRQRQTMDVISHVYPMVSDYTDVDQAVQAAIQAIRERIERAGILAGVGIQDVVHYRGDEFAEVRMRVNSRILDEFLDDPRWHFLLWFDLPGRADILVGFPQDADIEDVIRRRPPDGAPMLCIIDSGLAVGHPLLQPSVAENPGPFDPRLPHQYDEAMPTGHGTGVAGIALYYDLEDHWERREFTPAGFLANARITDHSNAIVDSGTPQGNEKLFATLIRNIVEYFAPRGCRIFNLSVCDRDKPFFLGSEEEQSLVTATVDRMSRDHDVLFVVSAGNILPDEVTFLHKAAPYPKYLTRRDIPENRILDPAQALTALTVGAVTPGSRVGLLGARPNRVTLGTPELLSPFSRTGPGIAGAIKPDLVEVGGNYAWDPEEERVVFEPRLGLVTLATTFTPSVEQGGVARPFQRMVGTSVSAPRTSRLALAVLDYLDPQSHPSSDLIRAFLTHSARPIEGVRKWIKDDPDFKPSQKGEWVNLIGYGQPDLERLFRIDHHRYVAVFDSGLEQALPLFHEHDRTQRGSVALFRIPIPTVLRETGNDLKRLTVTLAYRPPIKHSRLRSYPGVRMAWEVFRSDADPTKVWDYMAHSEDDESSTERPNVPGKYRLDGKAAVKRQRRSRGTLQHDFIEWQGHQFADSDEPIEDFLLAVAAWPNWESMPVNQVQSYALVVSLEVEPSERRRDIDIYTPVHQRLPVRSVIPVRLPIKT